VRRAGRILLATLAAAAVLVGIGAAGIATVMNESLTDPEYDVSVRSEPPAPIPPGRITVAVVLGATGSVAADVLAPYEVFARSDRFFVYTVAADRKPVALTGGLQMLPDRAFADVRDGPDVVVVDIRADASSGMAAIERLRAGHPTVAVFAIAAVADPDLILQAMRAGANEFFPWTSGGTQARSMEESFHSAVRRAAARHAAASAGARQPCATHVFLGAKGGAGTTTVAVNCAVELARLTKRPTAIIDLKPSLGEVALFLGVRPRFTVLDALENLHRLDREFLRELMAHHKSDLDILAGSEQFDRPNQQEHAGHE